MFCSAMDIVKFYAFYITLFKAKISLYNLERYHHNRLRLWLYQGRNFYLVKESMKKKYLHNHILSSSELFSRFTKKWLLTFWYPVK